MSLKDILKEIEIKRLLLIAYTITLLPKGMGDLYAEKKLDHCIKHV